MSVVAVTALLICFFSVVSAQGYAPKFVLGGAGSDFRTAPPGYVLASINDVQSSTFLSRYNVYGLNDSGERMSHTRGWCLAVAVREGFLVVGSLGYPTYIGPYGTNQIIQNTSVLSSPVWFGKLPGGSKSAGYVGPFSQAFADDLYTIPVSQSALTCNTNSHYGIYVRAEFGFAGYGRAFPMPPTANGQLATLADIQSDAFVTAYNDGGLRVVPGNNSLNNNMQGCCIFYSQDGYVTINGNNNSFLSPWTGSPPSSLCTAEALPNRVWFGTGPWGYYASQFIGQLNGTFISQLVAARSSFPASCNMLSPDTWAIFKFPPVPAPPATTSAPWTPMPTAVPPPPPPQDKCYKASFRVGYDNAGSVTGLCIADRWNAIIRLNHTYRRLEMNSLDECSFPVSAHNILAQPYTSGQLAVSTTGMTGCSCSNQAFIPTTSGSEMSTVCRKFFGITGFCEVLMNVEEAIKCPPPVPTPDQQKP